MLKLVIGLFIISFSAASFAKMPIRDNEFSGFIPVINVKKSYVQEWSAELGAGIFFDENKAFSHGPYLSWEPGVKGTKAHLGYGLLKGDSDVMGQIRASVVYLEMDKKNHDYSTEENYYGLDVSVGVNLFIFSAGLFRGEDSGDIEFEFASGIGF